MDGIQVSLYVSILKFWSQNQPTQYLKTSFSQCLLLLCLLPAYSGAKMHFCNRSNILKVEINLCIKKQLDFYFVANNMHISCDVGIDIISICIDLHACNLMT